MNKKLVIVLLIVFAVIAGGMYGGYMYLDSRINIDGYYSGISVAGVDISGLSKDEALDRKSVV